MIIAEKIFLKKLVKSGLVPTDIKVFHKATKNLKYKHRKRQRLMAKSRQPRNKLKYII